MNKYVVMGIAVVLLLLAGVGYNLFFASDEGNVAATGVIRIVPIASKQMRWEFEPEFIEVDQGDTVKITVINEDDYDHGFAIDAFGITQRLPAGGSIDVEFVATKAGDFPFYCSVSCGSGVVDGEKRGHFDHVGKFHVRSLLSETTTYEPEVSDEEIRQEARRSALRVEAEIQAENAGLNPSSYNLVIDENNSTWRAYSGAVAIDEVSLGLSGEDYQAVYFTERNSENIVFWVFIESSSGEVINHVDSR